MLIVMNGYSKSGKTTFVNALKKRFPDKFISVDSTEIHNFLNSTYTVFQDDNTIYGKGYDIRDETTKAVQGTLQEVLLKNGLNLIDDSCNSTREKRKKVIERAKIINPDIKSVVISIEIQEAALLERLAGLDDAALSTGKKKVWVDLYNEIQKPAFEKPTKDEADYVLFYDGENSDEIFMTIDGLLS